MIPSDSPPSRRNQYAIQSRDNAVTIYALEHPRNVSDFIRVVRGIRERGYQDVIVDVSATGRVFPNACLPIAALIQHYRTSGMEISVHGQPGVLQVAHFDQPLPSTADVLKTEVDPLSRIWQFQDERMINELVTAFVKVISERVPCSSGVLQAFEWCLNEVMDNVLQHSKVSAGFAIVQVHSETKRLAACIADLGIGIYHSLAQSKHKPRSAVDAITLAVKENVTRDPNIGQGNGLWGLLQIVKENSGILSITSGSGSLFIRGNQTQTFDRLPYVDKQTQGTIVDFQVDTTQGIDIARALGGHRPINLRLEELETETGEYLVRVGEHAHGTGTRRAAEQMRNFVINIVNERVPKVTLDFSGVAIISSSFADEFIGKLIVRYGFYDFQRIIELRGMNQAVQGIVHRSVAQRMMDSLREAPN